jgi:telomeric repeat-binding factor 2
LAPSENKGKRRRARKWSSLEEETLRNGVEQYVILSWCSDIIV